jgi:hypothetical protein
MPAPLLARTIRWLPEIIRLIGWFLTPRLTESSRPVAERFVTTILKLLAATLSDLHSLSAQETFVAQATIPR